MKALLLVVSMFAFASCSSSVIVKKDSCKDIYDGTLMECEEVSK